MGVNYIVTVIAIAISFIALAISYFSYLNSRQTVRAEVFLDLRQRFNEIHGQLPRQIFLEGIQIDDIDSDSLSTIQRYWLLSFDEWYITNKVLKFDRGEIWNGFYRRVQKTSLANPILRKILGDMLANNISFGNYGDEYIKEIKDIIRELALKNEAIPPNLR